MSEKFILARHGQPPLSFSGVMLAEQSSKARQGPRQNRWHELAVYRTDGGKLVARIAFESCWQGEESRSTVYVEDTEPGLIEAITARYDPHAGWVGHPFGVQDAERKNRLIEEAVIGGYRQAVADLLADAGIIETIE